MIQEPTIVHSESERESTSHVVHALMHFLLAVRHRKNVMFLSLTVAAILGGLYFTTATPYYGANASLLVMRSNKDYQATIGSEGSQHRNLMPTFVKLFLSTRVIRDALDYIRPEDRIDFAHAPQEAWPFIIQANLSAETALGTNVIEAGYRSKDPKTAVNVLNAVVKSYQAFLDDTHKVTSTRVMATLEKRLAEVNDMTAEKEEEQRRLRAVIGDMTSHSSANVVHPALKSATFFGEQLDDIHLQTTQLQGSLEAIRAAIHSGGDLQQHLMSVANVVGEELFANALGIDRMDAYFQSEMLGRLMKDRALLREMSRDYLPRHRLIIGVKARIRETEQFLASYPEQVSAKAAKLQDEVLGPKLEAMVQQKLDELRRTEVRLTEKFNKANAAAMQVSTCLGDLEKVEAHLEWLRESYDSLMGQMLQVDMRYDGQEVSAEVVHSPIEVANPVSPSLRRTIMLVLLGGLGLGMGAVYVLDILDDRFRSVEEMQSRLNVPVLSMIRQLAAPEVEGAEGLQVHTDPNSVECEAFRTLRTGLALADQEARRIVISSAEPSDGKTTVLANLAVSYAQANKRTLLIDADLRRPGMTAMMAMRGIDGLSGVIRGTDDLVTMATAHVRPSGIEGLDVLPSGPRPSNPAELLATPRFSELLAWAETVYDQVLIDSPPALATSDAAVIGRLVDGVVMVVQPVKNRRRMVIRAVESFNALKIPVLGLVINRVGADNDSNYYGYGDGYGYGYSYQYGEDPEESEQEPLSEEGVFGTAPGDRRSGDLSPGVVPKRVA